MLPILISCPHISDLNYVVNHAKAKIRLHLSLLSCSFSPPMKIKDFIYIYKKFECYLHRDVIFHIRVNKIGNNIDIQNILQHFIKSVLLTFK